MTTIAYKDGVLAADTLQTSGGVRTGFIVKIERREDGTMVAACGDAAFGHKFRAWVVGGEAGDAPLPTRRDDGDDSGLGIVFRPDGSVELYEGGGRLVTGGPYHAFGSGREFALGAMALGLGAEQAVKAAIAHCIYTGGEITVLRR